MPQAQRAGWVQEKTAALRRTLRLRDLVFMQLLLVVAPFWLGYAARLGRYHWIVWLGAYIAFYIPQAIVVTFLTRLLPLEGGIYQWAYCAFGGRVAFWAAWNESIYNLSLNASLGVSLIVYLRYIVRILSPVQWVPVGRSSYIGAGVCVVGLIAYLATRDVRRQRHFRQIAALSLPIAFGSIIVLAMVPHQHPNVTHFIPLSSAIFVRLSFGALCGFEQVAAFAGESFSPHEALPKSVVVGGIVVVAMYALGTEAILAFVSPDDIDIAAVIPQTLTIAGTMHIVPSVLILGVILILILAAIGAGALVTSQTARLMLVATWDNQLPSALATINPNTSSAPAAIYAQGAAILLFVGAGLITPNPEATWDFLVTFSFAMYAVCYVILFLIPFKLRRNKEHVPRKVLLAASCGMVMTLLYLAYSPALSINAGNGMFAVGMIVCFLLANVAGWLLYRPRQA